MLINKKNKQKKINFPKINQKNINQKLFFSIFLIASLFFIIIFSSVFSYVYNLNYYEKQYEKNNIYQKFEKNYLLNITKNLYGYLKYKNELDRNFFNEKEESHLNDVRIIIKNLDIIYKISLVIFFILLFYFLKKKYYNELFNSFIYSGFIGISFILLISIFYFLFGFDFLFEVFHKIFFTGNYAFDPRISNMKFIFPDIFFFDISKSIIILTIIKFILLILFGLFLKKLIR
ncbi:MAG: DUF1461 domain-containing protein [Candidatus Woesearchaeota archaeon]